jgi:hypothetical protein
MATHFLPCNICKRSSMGKWLSIILRSYALIDLAATEARQFEAL